jgi:signal transduction histidine kinase
MIGKQVRLNKLKNDFINTVSHELKTPLTSMCILVETLLEGRYYNEQQAKTRSTCKWSQRRINV